MCAADFRQQARDALRGNWLMAVIVGLLASVFGATSGGSFEINISSEQIATLVSGQVWEYLQPLVVMFGGLAVVWTLVSMVIGGALSMGYAQFNLNLVDGNDPRFEDLLSRFHNLWTGFCMQFWRGLYIFLWSLLLVIPGIVATYSYAMTPYILAENPKLTAREAIAASKELMRGNRWRLFCLNFSFAGWCLLCVLTLGIGNLWLCPYHEAAQAAFYREISGSGRNNDSWGWQREEFD